jgi:hypothetical protein
VKTGFIAVLVFFVTATGTPGLHAFICEKAAVLGKNQVVLSEGLFYTKFSPVTEPKVFEENPAFKLTGITADRDAWDVPFEIRIGFTENFTFGISASYLYNIFNTTSTGGIFQSGAYSFTSSGISGIGLKGLQRIIAEDSPVPGLSLIYGVSFPLGEDDYVAQFRGESFNMPIGDRGITLSILEAVSRDFGSFALDLNIGYDLRLPYTRKKDWQGDAVADRILDPGDRFIYGAAFEWKWTVVSFIFEIDGCACGNSTLDGTSIEGSGTHTVQLIPGFNFSPNASLTIEAGFRAAVLSRGGNAEYFYGPVFRIKQKL